MLLPATPTIKPGNRRVSKATSRPAIMAVADTQVWYVGQVLSEPSGSGPTCLPLSPTPDQMTGLSRPVKTNSEYSGQCLDSRSIALVEPPSHPKFIDPPYKYPCPFRQKAILVTGTNCNGYGVWINKTKNSGLDLMLFNRLRESWRTSPESWHLSRTYNTITVISHTITHGEHLLRVGT